MNTLFREMQLNNSREVMFASKVKHFAEILEDVSKDVKEMAERDYYFDGTKKEQDDVQ